MLFRLVNARFIQRFGDNLQSEVFPHFGKDFPTFVTQSLKCVRGSARLTSTAAEEFRAASTHRLGNRKRALAAFDRARPGNDGELIAPDTCLAYLDDRFFRPEIERHELVRFADPNRLRHARQVLELNRIERPLIAGQTNRRPGRSRHDVGTETHFANRVGDPGDFLFGGARFHYDEHGL